MQVLTLLNQTQLEMGDTAIHTAPPPRRVDLFRICSYSSDLNSCFTFSVTHDVHYFTSFFFYSGKSESRLVGSVYRARVCSGYGQIFRHLRQRHWWLLRIKVCKKIQAKTDQSKKPQKPRILSRNLGNDIRRIGRFKWIPFVYLHC